MFFTIFFDRNSYKLYEFFLFQCPPRTISQSHDFIDICLFFSNILKRNKLTPRYPQTCFASVKKYINWLFGKSESLNTIFV